MGEEKKNKRNKDFEVLTFALTLLAGTSAVLLKLVDYFNNNIISATISSLIHFFVLFLILEIVMLVLFLLLKGYSIWSLKEERRDILNNLSMGFGMMMFFIPIFILIYISLGITFSLFTKDWRLSSAAINSCIFGIMIFSAWATLYLGGVGLGDLKSIFKQISLKIKTQKNPNKQFLSLLFGYFIVLIYPLIVLAFIICLFQTTTFLLCGSYSIEIIQPSDPNTDIMSVTIRDTGIPSRRCFIDLSKVNESNESRLFESIDEITLNESGKSLSKHKYIAGEKRNGIYYLFINTSNLSSDDYLLHAEVTFFRIKGFDLFLPKKSDDKLFRPTPKNMTAIFVVHREI